MYGITKQVLARPPLNADEIDMEQLFAQKFQQRIKQSAVDESGSDYEDECGEDAGDARDFQEVRRILLVEGSRRFPARASPECEEALREAWDEFKKITGISIMKAFKASVCLSELGGIICTEMIPHDPAGGNL